MDRARTSRSRVGSGCPAPDSGSDAGFTLAEVIVAIGLFTVMAIAATTALVATIKLTNTTEDRVAASNLARQELETIRSQSANVQSLDLGPQSNVTLDNKVYTIDVSMAPDPTNTLTPCLSGFSRQVTIQVGWNGSGNRTVRFDSILAC